MAFETFKKLEISEDWFMLLEQNKQNSFIGRFYSASINFEDMNFGIYNTRTKKGFDKIGCSQHSEWQSIPFEEFVRNRKQIGFELQHRLDSFFEMIKVEDYKCYEGSNFIIHVPKFNFRIRGPKTKYSFLRNLPEDYDSYFIKLTDNDWRLEEDLNESYTSIPKEEISRIIETRSPFLSLLMTESKYAHGIY